MVSNGLKEKRILIRFADAKTPSDVHEVKIPDELKSVHLNKFRDQALARVTKVQKEFIAKINAAKDYDSLSLLSSDFQKSVGKDDEVQKVNDLIKLCTKSDYVLQKRFF